MTTETTEQTANWYFTFGHGQRHFNEYVKIHGTLRSSREEMFKRFGREWSMQYTEPEILRAIEQWGWTEVK